MKTKIGFLIMNIENGGGTERVTTMLANGLIKKGYEVSIISCMNGTNSKFDLNCSIKLLSLKGENTHNSFIRKIKNFIALRNIIKKYQFDILIAVDVSLYLYLLPFQLTQKIKCIAWEHFYYYATPNALSKISKKIAARYANCVVVLTNSDLENYRKNCKHIKRIERIYNPNSISKVGQANLESNRIIAVGRLEYVKGFDLLIKAWAKIENKANNWKLDIYGSGSLYNELQNLISTYNLKHIHLCGFTENIEKEFLNSSLFVLSSRYEGLGLVLIEAKSKGLPCISFACKEGPLEIIENNVNGYLVECGNVEELANKILYLINNKNVLKQFAANAKKDLEKYELNSVIENWITVFNTL